MTITQLFLASIFCAFAGFSMEEIPQQTITSLKDIKSFSPAEERKLHSLYQADFKINKELFSASQFNTISKNHLAPIIEQIILKSRYHFADAQMAIDFAQQISDSRFKYQELKPRLDRYIKKKALFTALEDAISREEHHVWKVEEIKIVNEENDDFVQKINSYKHLNDYERNKLIDAYAICVRPFTFDDLRHDSEIVEPKVCDPVEDYKRPRYAKHTTTMRTTFSHGKSQHKRAYKALLRKARRVTVEYNLDEFEQVKMAKCIAEQSLHFFVPSHHPLNALRKVVTMKTRSQDKAFFMHHGVCVNFSAMAYGILTYVNPQLEVYLVSNGVHVYLEFRKGNDFYHTHPFNRSGSCDFNRYYSKSEREENKKQAKLKAKEKKD